MIYRLQNIYDMEIKIENILILWDEKVTDIFVSLINTLSLSFSETEIVIQWRNFQKTRTSEGCSPTASERITFGLPKG